MNKTRLAVKRYRDNHQSQKTKLQKKKQYEVNKKRALIRKQNEINLKKQKERKQKREKMIEQDIDSGRFFELATSNKIYVNGLKSHEIKNEKLIDYTCKFELNGLMVIGPVERKTNQI